MGQQELGYLVEERVRILARVEELNARVTELEQQLQDSRQEVRLPLHLPVFKKKILCWLYGTRKTIVAVDMFTPQKHFRDLFRPFQHLKLISEETFLWMRNSWVELAVLNGSNWSNINFTG